MPHKYYVYTPDVIVKSLAKIPLPWSARIKKVINSLAYQPFLGEKMKGDMAPRRKIKVWPYRIIYRIREEIKFIVIVEVEHRGNTSYD